MNLMKDFISVNQKIEEKIIKKYIKYAQTCVDKRELSKNINNLKSYTLKEISKNNNLNNLISELEKVFNKNYYYKYKLNTISILKKYIVSPGMKTEEYYFFGVYTGILIVFLCIILIVCLNFDIDMDDDKKFKMIFPMFRGLIVLCFYMWMFCFCVSGWIDNHINYKLVFKYSEKYSELVDLVKHSSFWTMLTVFSIMLYLIQRTEIAQSILWWAYIFPLNVIPLIPWVILLCYLFFPSKYFFNYSGRIYLWNTLKDSFMLSTDFRAGWFSNQLVSLSGLLRDFAYTLCYFISYNDDVIIVKKKCTKENIIIFFITIIPSTLRMLQCVNNCIQSKKLYPNSINAGKYFVSIVSSYLSYIYRGDFTIFCLWVFVAICSAIYSFCWDIFMDWGFFEKNSPNLYLRSKLSFKNIKVYYYAIGTDFIFRLFFVLSISPEIVYSFIRPEFFTLVVLSAEVLRRSLWNYIRVEHKHIEICNNFRATEFIETVFYEKDGSLQLKSFNSKKDLDNVNARLNKIKNSEYFHNKQLYTASEFLNKLEDPTYKDFFVDENSDEEDNKLKRRNTLVSKIELDN